MLGIGGRWVSTGGIPPPPLFFLPPIQAPDIQGDDLGGRCGGAATNRDVGGILVAIASFCFCAEGGTLFWAELNFDEAGLIVFVASSCTEGGISPGIFFVAWFGHDDIE